MCLNALIVMVDISKEIKRVAVTNPRKWPRKTTCV
jgi:hypothetical protein